MKKKHDAIKECSAIPLAPGVDLVLYGPDAIMGPELDEDHGHVAKFYIRFSHKDSGLNIVNIDKDETLMCPVWFGETACFYTEKEVLAGNVSKPLCDNGKLKEKNQ